MEPISRLSRMMGLVRSERTGKARKSGDAASPSGAARPQGSRTGPGAQGVREQIGARIQGIDLDSPPGQQRAFRIFLEAVFRDELGEGLLGSPRFNDIVHEVQAVLSEDAAIRAELIELLRDMQSPS